jgi:polyhydroxyalkanoate depolymerase
LERYYVSPKMSAVAQPRVLLVAPLSVTATLLRGTVETLLPRTTSITDWHNGRDVSMTHGRFGFDQYVEHLMGFLEAMGPGVHVVAVCQSCVQALAAVAILSEAGSAATPRSMTLMAGPVDTRVNPTKVNELASARPIEWFEHNLIASVPSRFPGARRRVYPGFVQLTAFMGMNLERHINAHLEMYECLAGAPRAGAGDQDFYDEYFAVLDLPAEFYLNRQMGVPGTLARRQAAMAGRPLNFTAIRPRVLRSRAKRTTYVPWDERLPPWLCAGLRPICGAITCRPLSVTTACSRESWQSQIYPLLQHLILASDRASAWARYCRPCRARTGTLSTRAARLRQTSTRTSKPP